MPKRSSNISDRSQVKGEERNIYKPSDDLSRELATKKRLKNSPSVRSGNVKKQRNNTSKKTIRNGVKRIKSNTRQNKNRGGNSRGQKRDNGKRTHAMKNTIRRGGRNNHRMKNTSKKTRYGIGGSTTVTQLQKKQGTKNIQKRKEIPNTASIVAGGVLFYPSFEMMTCLADGMAPSYFPPTYFSSSNQDCCMTHFPGMVAECIIHSSDSFSGGGLFITVENSGKSGKSGVGWGSSSVIGGSSWMDSIGKAGKSTGKAGKSLNWVGIAWGGYSTYPTFYPTYVPTELPTTYIPTYYPTEFPTEQENIATGSPTTYSPTPIGSASIPTYYPTSLLPTLNPTLSSTYETSQDDDKEITKDDSQETQEEDGGTEKSLYSGSGDGTYYYDVTGRFCSQDAEPYAENEGYPTCTSFDKKFWKTLQEYNTNNIVAIDRTLLSTEEGREKYCGKEIKVYKDGKQMKGPFVVFDGCEACEGGGRIDFSLSALDDINDGEACDDGVVPDISWDVVDNQLIEFVP